MTRRSINFEELKAEALRLGFSACGAAPACPLPEWRKKQWQQWLADGRNGEMNYLANHLEKRFDPTLLMEGVVTIVSVALNYYTPTAPSPDHYRLARYALGKDYHEIMKEKLLALMQALHLTPFVDGRPCCDTAPVDEHYWAWRCGLGYLGRNTQLIIPKAGSYFFLGELLLTLPVDQLPPEPPYIAQEETLPKACLHCNRCVTACPAGAISLTNGLDARRCLSYLTIEKRGELPPNTGEQMGDFIYGCDRCAEVCPFNNKAQSTEVAEFHPSTTLTAMTREQWQQLTIEEYRLLFKGSAVKRAKYEGLLRNIKAVENN